MVEIVYMKEVPGLDPDFFLKWLTDVVESEGKTLGELSLVIGDDEWLHKYNMEFLNHDYYTDIITFDYSTNDLVSGDLLVSIERVQENAINENSTSQEELNRVVVHGVLHLCGYGDKTEEELLVMRQKEDYYLSLL
jgi:rRNA maturation RNase YbeY